MHLLGVRRRSLAASEFVKICVEKSVQTCKFLIVLMEILRFVICFRSSGKLLQ